jgi:molybdopterin molybdotransferase
MISVEEAKSLVEISTEPLAEITTSLENALGHVISQDIFSPIDLPPFNQSAMDGYAIAFKDVVPSSFDITTTIQAGDFPDIILSHSKAARIFTGAMIPQGTSAVVMQENVRKQGSLIVIDQNIQKGQNIRFIGEQIQKGCLALNKGTNLTAAGIGFLSSLGITQLKVFSKPKVGLIVTGNEHVLPPTKLSEGKIFESNSAMLKAALITNGFEVCGLERAKDQLSDTIKSIQSIFQKSDVILISGGISVGDFDCVYEALKILEVETIFYKVNQKPGKPLFFGKKDQKLFFGLPGNPSASLICFYIYVLPALRKMSGIKEYSLEKTQLQSLSNYEKKETRSVFLKAFATPNKVRILDGQSSAMLHTFAQANALVYLPQEKTTVNPSCTLTTYRLPLPY